MWRVITFITMQVSSQIVDPSTSPRSSSFELVEPLKELGELRIFRKGAHIQNIGKAGLTLAKLTDVLHNFSVSTLVAAFDMTTSSSFSWHSINHDSDLESFWLNRILVNEENPDEFSIVLLVEKGPSPESWYNVCLFNTRTEKYHFRGFCRDLTQIGVHDTAREHYIKRKGLVHAKNTNFYVDYSNMTAPYTFWTNLKRKIE